MSFHGLLTDETQRQSLAKDKFTIHFNVILKTENLCLYIELGPRTCCNVNAERTDKDVQDFSQMNRDPAHCDYMNLWHISIVDALLVPEKTILIMSNQVKERQNRQFILIFVDTFGIL